MTMLEIQQVMKWKYGYLIHNFLNYFDASTLSLDENNFNTLL